MAESEVSPEVGLVYWFKIMCLCFFFLNLLLVENSWKEMLRHCISCEKNEVYQTKSHQKNIKNLQNSVKRPWVEAFLYYLNFELNKTAEMNRNLI